MAKPRTLANTVSEGGPLADGAIAVGDVTGLQAALDEKQAALVSGTNIKTVNGGSVLGSGDVAVQPTLVSGTNIKTINGGSVLGPGDLAVGGGAWVVLGSGTISGNPTAVDFETGFTDATYSAIVILLTNVFTNSGSGNPTFRFKQGGSWGTTSYDSQMLEASGSGVSTNRNANQPGMMFAAAQVLDNVPYSDMFIVKNRFSTIAAGPSIATLGVQSGSGVALVGIGQGVRQVGGAVQGARFYLSGGGGSTILTSGSYVWYGIKAS